MALWKCSAQALFAVLAWSWMTRCVNSEPPCPLIAPPSEYLSFANHATPVPGPGFFRKVEHSIQSYVSSSAIPQYAVAVVIGNQTVFTSGLPSTPFLIGSVTKSFTALGALLLREQGRLSLDDPVHKFLPEFSIINPYSPHNITLRELMGHVSGMPRELCDALYVLGVSEDVCPHLESDVLKLISKMQLARPPWSREPDYSNLGFGLLGHAWEKATSPSMSWDDFIKAYVFDPLQMTDSGVDSSNVTLAGRDSTGAPEFDIGWVAPAGQIFSTAIDLAKYLKFIITAEPPLISDASIREWTRSCTVFPDRKGGFALPWELISTNITSEFLITKDGAVGNYEAFVAIHTPTQIGVSVLMTYNDSTTGSVDDFAGAILAALIPRVEDLNAKAIYPPYTGFYVCTSSDDSNDVVQGSSVNVTYAPAVGLFAAFNLSVILDGTVAPFIGDFALFPRNTTENSFWYGPADSCIEFFGGISDGPSEGTPNFPGSPYAGSVVFDLTKETLASPYGSVLCKKKSGRHHF